MRAKIILSCLLLGLLFADSLIHSRSSDSSRSTSIAAAFDDLVAPFVSGSF